MGRNRRRGAHAARGHDPTARVLQAAALVLFAVGVGVAAVDDRSGSSGLSVRSTAEEATKAVDRGEGDAPTTTTAATTLPAVAVPEPPAEEVDAPPADAVAPLHRHVEVVDDDREELEPSPPPAPAPPAPAPAPARALAPAPSTSVLSDAESTLLHLANQARAASGLAPLASNAHLHDVARRWATHLAATGSLAHNPSYPEQILAGRDCMVLAENVAYRLPADAYAMHEQLMASPRHAANILDDRMTHVGTAAVADSSGRMWVVQDFCG